MSALTLAVLLFVVVFCFFLSLFCCARGKSWQDQLCPLTLCSLRLVTLLLSLMMHKQYPLCSLNGNTLAGCTLNAVWTQRRQSEIITNSAVSLLGEVLGEGDRYSPNSQYFRLIGRPNQRRFAKRKNKKIFFWEPNFVENKTQPLQPPLRKPKMSLFFSSLSPQQKKLCRLRASGLTMKEIAELTNHSHGYTRNCFVKIRKILGYSAFEDDLSHIRAAAQVLPNQPFGA